MTAAAAAATMARATMPNPHTTGPGPGKAMTLNRLEARVRRVAAELAIRGRYVEATILRRAAEHILGLPEDHNRNMTPALTAQVQALAIDEGVHRVRIEAMTVDTVKLGEEIEAMTAGAGMFGAVEVGRA